MIKTFIVASVALSLSSKTFSQTNFTSQSQYESKAFSPQFSEDTASMKFAVRMDNELGEKINMSFHSDQGSLWEANSYDKQFARSFDLSQLEDGLYRFIVRRGDEKWEKTIHIQTQVMTVRKKLIY